MEHKEFKGERMAKKPKEVRGFLALSFLAQILVIVFALATVFQKMAARSHQRAGVFLAFFVLAIVILMVYSALWQQLLKRFSMLWARLHRIVAMVWILIFAMLFFGEKLSANAWLGSAFICAGVLLCQFPVRLRKGRIEEASFKELRHAHVTDSILPPEEVSAGDELLAEDAVPELRYDPSQGASFYHFLGDAFSMPAYRDIVPKNKESLFFRLLDKKKHEMQLRRQLRQEEEKNKKQTELEIQEAQKAVQPPRQAVQSSVEEKSISYEPSSDIQPPQVADFGQADPQEGSAEPLKLNDPTDENRIGPEVTPIVMSDPILDVSPEMVVKTEAFGDKKILHGGASEDFASNISATERSESHSDEERSSQ